MSDKKRVFIIHGWEGYSGEGWFPWLKGELEGKGFEVTVPAMPNPADPEIKAWTHHLAQLVGEPDESTYLVGHSIGVQAILRYLESIEGKKVGGVVLVAGFFALVDLGDEEDEAVVRPWLTTSIDCEVVKRATTNITAIFSDNDKWVPLEQNKRMFEERLGAKTVVQHNKGHFSGSDNIKELPIVLEVLLSYN